MQRCDIPSFSTFSCPRITSQRLRQSCPHHLNAFASSSHRPQHDLPLHSALAMLAATLVMRGAPSPQLKFCSRPHRGWGLCHRMSSILHFARLCVRHQRAHCQAFVLQSTTLKQALTCLQRSKTTLLFETDSRRQNCFSTEMQAWFAAETLLLPAWRSLEEDINDCLAIPITNLQLKKRTWLLGGCFSFRQGLLNRAARTHAHHQCEQLCKVLWRIRQLEDKT